MTPPFGGHNIWSPKNVEIIFVFVSSGEGTLLFMGKGLSFDSGFNVYSGYILALKR